MLANASPSQRPPPIQMGVAQTPWGQSMDPFAERDAFVRQIGQQRINNQIAFNTSGPNAPQGSPFINYDMARQNAGLAGGAPSMNANPADTFIGRFNNQYGAPNPGFGGGQPPAYGQSMRSDPKMNPNRPPPGMQEEFNARGETLAFYPKTGWGPLDSGSKATSTVDFGPGPMPTQPSRPGNAQPITQPPQGTPYSPAGGSRPATGNGGVYEQNGNTYFSGGVGGPPPPPPGFEWLKSARNRESPLILKRIDPTTQPPQAGIRSAADSPTSPEYQKWRSGQAQTMEWRGPEGEAKREADMHRRWMEETGRAPASGDFRPKPGAPQGPRMPYAGGMDYEQGPPVQRPGLTLRPPPRRTGMAGYHTTRRL